jgi:hypothetical protein
VSSPPASRIRVTTVAAVLGYQSLMSLEPSRHWTPLIENAMLSWACRRGWARGGRRTLVYLFEQEHHVHGDESSEDIDITVVSLASQASQTTTIPPVAADEQAGARRTADEFGGPLGSRQRDAPDIHFQTGHSDLSCARLPI